MAWNLNTYWSRIIIEELVRCGVENFCISPGSRSTPLVVAAARNPHAKTTICYDERSSAFYALGLARATDRPAVVITTSGTAVANLLPAITEASVDKVPMLLLTADRPPELCDTGANQTLDQASIFGRFTRWNFDLPCPDTAVPPEMLLTTIDQAVYRTTGLHPGPVHINCRFREPLEPSETGPDEVYTANIEAWAQSDRAFTQYGESQAAPSAESLDVLVKHISGTDRGMILIGRLDSDAERRAITGLIEKLNWPVYADITSGLRLGVCGTNVIRHFDQQLLSEQFNAKACPQLVMHFGGRTTSKRIGLFFTRNRPEHYIVVKQDPDRYDPVHAVTEHIRADIASLCIALSERLPATRPGGLMSFYDDKAAAAQQIISEHIAAAPALTEPFVARHISKRIPDRTALVLSSSMCIRDMDLYCKSSGKAIAVAANRGISGIDGVIATACGFAKGRECTTTAVIGDIAFIHDLNSLAVVAKSEYPVIIVLINNHGGGIFDFLDISKTTDVFEDFFVAPHDFTFGGVCETFGLAYIPATTKEQFIDAYERAVAESASTVIEVNTEREHNLELRRNIKKAIIEALEK